MSSASPRDLDDSPKSRLERLVTLSRENPHPVLECDAEGRPVYANPAAERIARELGLDGVLPLLPRDHCTLVRACLEQGDGFEEVEIALGGRMLSWTYRPHVPTRAVYLYAVDLTVQRQVEDQLRHDALHDSLTGLPNRLLFMERLAHALVRSKRHAESQFAVLFLDLDRFKVINDSLGHQAGDELLRVVARRLQGCIRTEDTVARLGGDEFAILLEEVGGVNEVTRVGERIQTELAAPVMLNGLEVFTSASIGIALSSSAYDRPEQLVRNADMAMYRAKAAGLARFEVFDRAMHAQALLRLQLETDLRRALEGEELRLHYQPVVELATGEVRGLEALVRWEHPEQGLLAPEQFLPLAEETGIIFPLGERVLRETCRQLREWRERFPAALRLSVGVNLSAREFAQAELVESISAVLREHDLPPRALRLEITESAFLDQPDAASVVLRRLRSLGVRVSLDDFGTGYSSLGWLHRLALDVLKVDRSLVGRVHDEAGGAKLVDALLALGRSLGIAVVAEGVETEEQLRALRERGCGFGQGFFFSRPLPAEGVERLLRGPSGVGRD